MIWRFAQPYKMKRLQVAVAGLSLLVCPAVFGQTVKVNSNAKAQFSKYKTSSWKASTNPRNPQAESLRYT